MFVLLHLEDPERKETVLLELLCRQCSSCEEPEEKEKFIIEELNLSPSLVYFAKVRTVEYLNQLGMYTICYRPRKQNMKDLVSFKLFTSSVLVSGIRLIQSYYIT